MSSKPRIAFVTIGQSPRDDIMDEMLPVIGAGIDVHEVGALDGLNAGEIAAMAPQGGEAQLATRLRDGSEAITSKAQTATRVQAIMDRLDEEDFHLVVMLCTGYFEGLHTRTLMVEAQRVVDRMVDALSHGDHSLGIMVPLAGQEKQVRETRNIRDSDRITHASPYSEGRLEAAADELSGTDLIVMHCMGYTEPMREVVAGVTGKPVLLARRVVANAVAQLV